MNIVKISEIIIESIIIIVSAFYMEGHIRIFSDFFVARNPFFKGELVVAKIKGFYRYHFDKQIEYFSIIEYQDNGKKADSVVQRDLRDKIDECIAVSVASGNYTVRYKWYLPYELSGKIFVSIITSAIFWSIFLIFWQLEMYRMNIAISIIIGMICGYLGHAKLIYYCYYSKNCIRIKSLEGRMGGLLKNIEPIHPMGESIIEKTDFNQLPSHIKLRYCLIIGICILLVLVDLWSKVFG